MIELCRLCKPSKWQTKHSVVFLSETKVHDLDTMNKIRMQLRFRNREAVWSDGQSGGIVMFWEEGLDFRFLSKSTHRVDVEVFAVDGSGVHWRLSGFYGHPSANERWRTWNLL